jgi:hypothetical protein
MNAKIKNTLFACFVSLNLFSQQIVSGEYFFDTAPVLGGGTTFTVTPSTDVNHSMSISTTSLSPGFHNLFIRVKNNLNIWSHYEGRMVYIMPTQISTITNLVSGEYFFDTDPGLGNGTSIAFTAGTNVSPSLTVPTATLSSGFHNLFIRVKNSAGKWSHYEGRLFYVMPVIPSSTPTILNGEYFVDTDPGLGNGTAISFTSGTNVSPIINVNTSSLAAGNHNLFIRVKNSAGKWSHYEGRAFFICANALATSVISGNTSYCAGQTIVLNGTSVPNATSYLWTGPNGYSANGLTMQRTNSTVSMSGNYVLKAIRAGGTLCDTSTISYAVIVNPTYTTNNPQTICQGESYTFNGNTYTTAGNYPSVLQSITGCDSTVVTQLTVRPTYTTNNPQTICQGESYTYNGNTYTTPGSYPTLLQSIYGCDSTVVTQLTVRPNYTTNNPQSICQGGSYSIGGNTYTAEGTYSDLLQSIYGCDSIVTTVITFTPVQLNLNVTTSGLTISSAQNAGSYQWINCANNAAISGANSQNYTATANGSYAVILTECGVSDTSNCVVINDVGLDENNLNFNVQLYPNPTEDILTIEVFGANLKRLIVTDLNGKILSKQPAFGNTNNLNVTNLSAGVYLVNIETENGVLVRRFVKR